MRYEVNDKTVCPKCGGKLNKVDEDEQGCYYGYFCYGCNTVFLDVAVISKDGHLIICDGVLDG